MSLRMCRIINMQRIHTVKGHNILQKAVTLFPYASIMCHVDSCLFLYINIFRFPVCDLSHDNQSYTTVFINQKVCICFFSLIYSLCV